MFQHILLASDGSAACLAAAAACIRFAAEVRARVTAVHVEQPLHMFTYEPQVTEQAHEAYRRVRAEHARACLEPIEELAKAANVDCATMVTDADEPWEGIIKTAHERHCDVIMMASHGHGGVRSRLLGSQTHKLLTHSAIPVLVYR